MIDHNRIVTDIDWIRQKYERYQTEIEEKKTPVSDTKFYRVTASNARSIAEYEFATGDSSYRTFMADAVRLSLQALEGQRARRVDSDDPAVLNWQSDPNRLRDMLHDAVLAEDDELRYEVAKTMVELPESYLDEYPETARYYWYPRTLAATLLDADEFERDLAELEASFESDNLVYRGWARCLAGIHNRDSDVLADGLANLTAYHEQELSNEPKTASEFIDFHAVPYLVLAKERDIDIEYESSYLPDRADELI